MSQTIDFSRYRVAEAIAELYAAGESEYSKIEWTDATWNPVTGCTKVSEGCDHCCAERITERFGGKGSFEKVVLHPEKLDDPFHWRKPRRVFVNSMSDLFHDDVPDEFIAQVFAAMALSPRHTFQILTKRPGRMASLLSDENDDWANEVWECAAQRIGADRDCAPCPWWPGRPLPNVWLGVSVENQKWADVRIPKLLETPAAVRFLSVEPLLGPVDLTPVFVHPAGCGGTYEGIGFVNGTHQRIHRSRCLNHRSRRVDRDITSGATEYVDRIHWVIVGGESGPGARPMHPDWARSLRDQCVAAGVPFFFKQWGEWQDGSGISRNGSTITGSVVLNDGRVLPWGDFAKEAERAGIRDADWPLFAPVVMSHAGKKRAGRELDGRTWDEMPAASSGDVL